MNCRRVNSLTNQSRCYVVAYMKPFRWACLQGGIVTLASWLTLTGGEKIVWVYPVTLKGSGKSYKVNPGRQVSPTWLFKREEVTPFSTLVTLTVSL